MKDNTEAKRPPLGNAVGPEGVSALAGGKIRKILNYKNGSAKTEPVQERHNIATLALCFSRALIFDPSEDLSRRRPLD